MNSWIIVDYWWLFTWFLADLLHLSKIFLCIIHKIDKIEILNWANIIPRTDKPVLRSQFGLKIVIKSKHKNLMHDLAASNYKTDMVRNLLFGKFIKGELTAIPNTIISLCRSINIITNKYIPKAEVSR